MTTSKAAQPTSSALTPPGGSVRGRLMWYELMTSDPAAALRFYRELFGWSGMAFDGAEEPYTMFMRGEMPVAGLMGLTDEMRAGGVPPSWLPYVGTDDVDATVALATSLGASVMLPGTDIPDIGRVAVLADPQGGAFGLYRPSGEAAPENAPEVGEFSWIDLAADDHAAAFDFYEKLFGWRNSAEHEMGPGWFYRVIARGDADVAGMFSKVGPTADMPTGWTSYVRVDDINKACEHLERLGGVIQMAPSEVPGGDLVASVADAQGASFALHQKRS